MESKVIRYPGVDLTIEYDLKRCIHAAECVNGLPQVFNPKRKPWIDADQGSADEVAGVIQRCPSGALAFSRHDGGAEEVADESNTVTVVADGPLYARGTITLKSAAGDTISEETRVALCRCGASANKPFCDNSHNKSGFNDEGALKEIKMKPVEEATGDSLTIVLASNGPLLLEGPVTIHDAGQNSAAEGSKAALCRCGQSSNKPFCDGTHKKVGFEG